MAAQVSWQHDMNCISLSTCSTGTSSDFTHSPWSAINITIQLK